MATIQARCFNPDIFDNNRVPEGHTVKPGDTLSAIARANNVGLQELINANPQIKNPDLIYPGQVVQIPASEPVTSEPVLSCAPPEDSSASGVRPRTSTGAPISPNGGLSPEMSFALRFGAIKSDDTLQLPREAEEAIAAQAPSEVAETATGFTAPSVTVSGPTLREGSSGAQVEALQTRLSELGYSVGVDGDYGRLTGAAVRQFQAANGMKADGVLGPNTMNALNSAAARPAPKASALDTSRAQYAPNSSEAIALFEEAAARVGLPKEWASSPALHELLRRESNGQVGRPNYTYGSRAKNPAQWASIHNELKRGIRTTKSSATGLGQLLLANVDAYYPSGRAGIGDPVEEAAGMLKYIEARYGSPEKALLAYGTRHEGY